MGQLNIGKPSAYESWVVRDILDILAQYNRPNLNPTCTSRNGLGPITLG